MQIIYITSANKMMNYICSTILHNNLYFYFEFLRKHCIVSNSGKFSLLYYCKSVYGFLPYIISRVYSTVFECLLINYLRASQLRPTNAIQNLTYQEYQIDNAESDKVITVNGELSYHI